MVTLLPLPPASASSLSPSLPLLRTLPSGSLRRFCSDTLELMLTGSPPSLPRQLKSLHISPHWPGHMGWLLQSQAAVCGCRVGVCGGELGVCMCETPGRSLYPHLGCRQVTITGILALMCSQRMLKLVLKDKELRLRLPAPQQPCSLRSDQPPLLGVGRR